MEYQDLLRTGVILVPHPLPHHYVPCYVPCMYAYTCVCTHTHALPHYVPWYVPGEHDHLTLYHMHHDPHNTPSDDHARITHAFTYHVCTYSHPAFMNRGLDHMHSRPIGLCLCGLVLSCVRACGLYLSFLMTHQI